MMKISILSMKVTQVNTTVTKKATVFASVFTESSEFEKGSKIKTFNKGRQIR